MTIDYSGLKFPKKPAAVKKPAPKPAGRPKPKRRPKGTAKRRAGKRRAVLAEAADDRAVVFARQQHTCIAVRVSPVCTRQVQDPHELIPVGIGGPRESWNRVGVCRACHDAAQGTVGGARLMFRWPGWPTERPNADQPGNVRCFWRGDET